MARFGIQLKSRRKAGIGGFHAEYLNDRTAVRQRQQMGYLRTIFSAVSLLFGGLMIYVGLHYIPAFVQPAKIIRMASPDIAVKTKSGLDQRSPFGQIIGPYIDMFAMERAYIEGGQSVEVRYNLPKGAKMDVAIQQCRRLWVVEIFECQVINEQVVRIDANRGKQTFTLPSSGFYHFDERVQLEDASQRYRIIWARS